MTQVVGHQGTSEGVAPGTLAAYEQALADGIEMVEVDVRRTGDGAFRALHDPGDDRTAARLAEVASLVAAAGRRLMVDLKEIGGEAEALAVVLAELPPGRVVVSTLEDASVAALRDALPELEVGLSVGREWRRPFVRNRLSEIFPAARARACGATFLSVNRRLLPSGILRRAPLPVYVWTVDDDRELRRHLRDPRLRGVITNRPRRALELLRS